MGKPGGLQELVMVLLVGLMAVVTFVVPWVIGWLAILERIVR